MRFRTPRLCLSSLLSSTLLSSSVPLTSRGQTERWWLWTTDGLYYSRYIKHFLGGRGVWVDEICERDDVAHEGIVSVMFLRSKKEWREEGEERHWTLGWHFDTIDLLHRTVVRFRRQLILISMNARVLTFGRGNDFLVKITCNCFV